MPLADLLGAVGRDPAVCASFLEQISAGVVVLDAKGKALAHNAAAARLFGGAVPEQLRDAVFLTGSEAKVTPVARALEGDATNAEELQLQTAAGPKRLRTTVLPL